MTLNNNKNKIADIKLALNEVEMNTMSDLQKNMLHEELAELPPIEEGQVNITGVYIFDMGDKLEVNVYVRNGVNNKLSFDVMPLAIMDSKDNILAKQVFDMRDLGIVPPLSVRPYKVYFNKENIFVDKIDSSDWKIVFGDKLEAKKNVLVEYEDLSKDISYELKRDLEEFLISLPMLQAGSISINSYKMQWMEEDLSIVLVIRNGNNRGINIEKLPISIKDSEGNLVAGGNLEIQNMSVNPYKAKVFNLVLGKNNIVINNADLNNCNILFEF